MASRAQASQSGEWINGIIKALNELRDVWLNMSLELQELLTEAESVQRDALLYEVDRYLMKIGKVNL